MEVRRKTRKDMSIELSKAWRGTHANVSTELMKT